MRINQITFTRFIAAIFVVIYHFGTNVRPFNGDGISFIFQSAIWVSYFFTLSGFVMIIAYYHKEKIIFFEYIINRIARIYPIYILALILVIIFYIFKDINIDYISLFLNITTLQSRFSGHQLSLNYPGRSISVEIFFYMIFPFLFNKIYKKLSIKKLFIISLIIRGISQFIVHLYTSSIIEPIINKTILDFINYLPLSHINEFIIGNVAGIIYMQYLKDNNKNNDIIILGITILLVIILKYRIEGINLHNGFLSGLFGILIIFISTNKKGKITSFFNNKNLLILGESSYSIYILQYPIYLYTTIFLEKSGIQNPFYTFYIFLSILIISSVISFKYIEIPINNKIKDLYKKYNTKIPLYENLNK